MSANLNEFKSEQLQVLLNVVVAKIIDLEEHRSTWEQYFNQLSYEYNAMDKIKELTTLQLFRVQILNAIVEVKSNETIQQT